MTISSFFLSRTLLIRTTHKSLSTTFSSLNNKILKIKNANDGVTLGSVSYRYFPRYKQAFETSKDLQRLIYKERARLSLKLRYGNKFLARIGNYQSRIEKLETLAQKTTQLTNSLMTKMDEFVLHPEVAEYFQPENSYKFKLTNQDLCLIYDFFNAQPPCIPSASRSIFDLNISRHEIAQHINHIDDHFFPRILDRNKGDSENANFNLLKNYPLMGMSIIVNKLQSAFSDSKNPIKKMQITALAKHLYNCYLCDKNKIAFAPEIHTHGKYHQNYSLNEKLSTFILIERNLASIIGIPTCYPEEKFTFVENAGSTTNPSLDPDNQEITDDHSDDPPAPPSDGASQIPLDNAAGTSPNFQPQNEEAPSTPPANSLAAKFNVAAMVIPAFKPKKTDARPDAKVKKKVSFSYQDEVRTYYPNTDDSDNEDSNATHRHNECYRSVYTPEDPIEDPNDENEEYGQYYRSVYSRHEPEDDDSNPPAIMSRSVEV